MGTTFFWKRHSACFDGDWCTRIQLNASFECTETTQNCLPSSPPPWTSTLVMVPLLSCPCTPELQEVRLGDMCLVLVKVLPKAAVEAAETRAHHHVQEASTSRQDVHHRAPRQCVHLTTRALVCRRRHAGAAVGEDGRVLEHHAELRAAGVRSVHISASRRSASSVRSIHISADLWRASRFRSVYRSTWGLGCTHTHTRPRA